MKLKKFLAVTIISILILTFSTNSFAMTLREKLKSKSTNEASNLIENETNNEVNNEVDNKTSNEVNNEVDNKTNNEVNNKVDNKTKNEVSNEVDNKTKNKVDNKVDNKTSKNEVENENTSTKEDLTTDRKKEIINKDISIFETNDELEYDNLKINGNVFIVSSNKVTLNNLEVNGDIMLFTSEASEILNSEIDGSVYIASADVFVKDSKILSLYSIGNNLNIERNTEITRELKLIGNEISFDGEVRRDFFAMGGKVKIDNNGKVDGKAIIKSEEKRISRIASINDLDYERINYTKNNYEESTGKNVNTYLISKGIELIVILFVAIFLFCGFPKFLKVNSNVRLGKFFIDFLLGLLIFIIGLAISVALMITGYGIGYGLILLNILFVFILLGKILFIITFAIRLTSDSGNVSTVKAFFGTILVSIVLALIGMISLAGSVGAIINSILSVILAFTGFGAIFETIFTSKKKYENNLGENYKKTSNVIKQDEKKNIIIDKDSENKELKQEIKEEVKQEINELKEERKLENEIIEENKNSKNSEENINNDENNENVEDKKEE